MYLTLIIKHLIYNERLSTCKLSNFLCQVQPAPPINAPPIKPEIKTNPNEETTSDISLVPYGPPSQENGEDDDSPQLSSKLTFELGKKSTASSNTSRIGMEGIFSHEEEKEEVKPKKKLYTLTSSSKGSHFTAAMADMPHGGVVTAEDRKKLIQSLVSSIPSKRDELFNWDLKWNQIDQVGRYIHTGSFWCVYLR